MTYAQRRAIMILSGQPPIEITIAPFVSNEPMLKTMAGKRQQIAQVEARNKMMQQEKMMAIFLLSSQGQHVPKRRRRG